ncbi:hypothetical protein KIH41_17580 [Litoribacter ruber]|uniref:hypothetical protein n=1 Tax=Litoribacter ruber TaxID=702568 RepID=UPI001BD993E0|nr:hypothetical protein [Litoribacter ruber]MBT0813104.1 hypothetical protein [Litoribacter ruber]
MKAKTENKNEPTIIVVFGEKLKEYILNEPMVPFKRVKVEVYVLNVLLAGAKNFSPLQGGQRIQLPNE